MTAPAVASKDAAAAAAPAAPSPAPQGSAVRGASLLIVLQIASRAVTFVANQLLLRFLTAQLLGVSTQLEVYYLSVLFFARESLRVAIQRQGSTTTANGTPSTTTTKTAVDAPHKSARDSQSVVNVGHLAVVIGLGAALGLGTAYLRYVDAAAAATPYLDAALYIYGLSAIIELLSEPAFVVLQHRLRFGPRAVAESTATFFRCALTFGAAGWAWRNGLELGVLPFALGQLGYGLGLLGTYLWYGWRLAAAEGFSLLPKRIVPASQATGDEKRQAAAGPYALGYFYTPTLNLASSMTAQSFVKHILTQGDTFLVSILSNPEAQGVYALANNYGSLLARLVFQPVEESSRNYFSKLLASPTATGKKNGSGEKPVGLSGATLAKASADLQSVLHAYLLMSILILSLGPFGAPLLVQIVAGPAWASSGAGRVLAQYCLYIPLLALNGITEAFVSSVASEAEVHRQSLWMGSFSVAFGAAGFVCLRVLDLGAAGLVYANAINMLCRIAWSAAYIRRYFDTRAGSADEAARFRWACVLPSGLGVLVACTAVLWQALVMSGVQVGSVSTHVFRDLLTVCGLALPYVGVVAYMERQYLVECYRSLRPSS